MALRFRPLHDTFGAEVVGVDFSRDVDAGTFAEIEDAWRRYSILLFRGVTMTPAQHVAFTRKLGPLHIMEPLEFNLPGFPEVLVVSNMEKDNKPIGMKRAGWGWHSDGEDKVLPNAGSFIHALKLPPADGDTMYADTYAAFAALPADVRRKIMGRRACFSRQRFHEVYYPHLPPLTDEQKKARPDVWHPIARRHPKSGWTALYIGRWAYKIDGMPDDRGAGVDRLPEGLRDAAGIRLPPPMARRRCAAVGQPLRAALRDAVRRRELSAADAAHDARRRSAAHGRARSVPPGTGAGL